MQYWYVLYVCVSSSVMSDSVTPWTPLSTRFSRQEYWCELPFPNLGDLPNPGIKPGSPVLQADSLPSEPTGKFTILAERDTYVRRVCNFLCSVSSQQRFEMADECYSSVTAQIFIWQTKDSTTPRCEGGPTPKERQQSSWLPLFISFVSSPLSPPYAN